MWSYQVQNDQGGKPRWWLYNGSVTEAVSGESFYDFGGAKNAALNFKQHASAWSYITFQASDRRWYWHARASNNKNVASSGRGFSTQAEADASSARVRANGGGAPGP